jgi:anti-sigma B factor antagonist
MAGVTDRDGPTPAPPASIRVETVVAPDGTALLSIAGELDVATEGVVRAALDEALARQPVRVVVDLAGVEFIDSSGLLLLVATAASAVAFEVRNPSCVVRRVIELAGVASMLNLTP